MEIGLKNPKVDNLIRYIGIEYGYERNGSKLDGYTIASDVNFGIVGDAIITKFNGKLIFARYYANGILRQEEEFVFKQQSILIQESYKDFMITENVVVVKSTEQKTFNKKGDKVSTLFCEEVNDDTQFEIEVYGDLADKVLSLEKMTMIKAKVKVFTKPNHINKIVLQSFKNLNES